MFLALALSPVFSFAAVKTVVLTGVRAQAIFFAAAALDLRGEIVDDNATVDLTNVVAEKLGDVNGKFVGERLTIVADRQGEQINIHYEVLLEDAMRNRQRQEQADQLERFRLALEDVLKPVVVRKPAVVKGVMAHRIKCLARDLGRSRDGVETEARFTCLIRGNVR